MNKLIKLQRDREVEVQQSIRTSQRAFEPPIEQSEAANSNSGAPRENPAPANQMLEEEKDEGS